MVFLKLRQSFCHYNGSDKERQEGKRGARRDGRAWFLAWALLSLVLGQQLREMRRGLLWVDLVGNGLSSSGFAVGQRRLR